MTRKIKTGFSDIGGIYIGDNITTDTHVHHAVTIAVSFSEQFVFEYENTTVSCYGIVIQPHTIRKFINPHHARVAFVHIEPFSDPGLILREKTGSFRELTDVQIQNIVRLLKSWFVTDTNNEDATSYLIQQIVSQTGIRNRHRALDERITKTIALIRISENTSLKNMAAFCHLSTYRFSHLFRQETGLSFREFVLYTKLVRSLKAICQNQSLTQSSYAGGFADQAHFTRTYLKAFGILPSQTVK